MRILRELWPAVLGRLRKQLDKLGDLLGKYHDLAVLRSAALEQIDDISGKTVREFLELVESRKLELQTEAQTIGERVYAGFCAEDVLVLGNVAG
jgi:CHAD domain-containing protein